MKFLRFFRELRGSVGRVDDALEEAVAKNLAAFEVLREKRIAAYKLERRARRIAAKFEEQRRVQMLHDLTERMSR